MNKIFKILIILLVFFYIGCTTVETPEKELELSVQIEGGGITVKSGETVIIEAVVSNAAADDISYTWYTEDIKTGAMTRFFEFDIDTDDKIIVPITVEVTDGISTARARTYVSITPVKKVNLKEATIIVGNSHPSFFQTRHDEVTSTLSFYFLFEFINCTVSDIEYFRVYHDFGGNWAIPMDSPLDENNFVWVKSFYRYTDRLSSNRSVVPIKHLRLEVVVTDGEKMVEYFNLPVPGSNDNGGISFIYTEDYRGVVTQDYHPALAQAIIENYELQEDQLLIDFVIKDDSVQNIQIAFWNNTYGYVGGTDYLINTLNGAISEVLNNGQELYTDGRMNTLRISIEDILFENEYSVKDVESFYIRISDGLRDAGFDSRFRIEYISRSEKLQLF
jgi:hypothetical protein